MKENSVLNTHNRMIRIQDIPLLFSVALNIIMVLAMRMLGSQMYPFFLLFYLWVVFYIFFLAVLLKRGRAGKIAINTPLRLASIIMFAILIRLIFIGQTEIISLDGLWYIDFGNFMYRGYIPYSEFYFPYPPVFAYLILAIYHISPVIDSFRILAAVLDGICLVPLYKITSKWLEKSWASIAVLSYAFLPISIIESGWNGHFEPLSNLFLLLALYFAIVNKSKLSGISMGLAIATKLYPGFLFLPLMFYFRENRMRLQFALATFGSVAISFLPFLVLIYSKSFDFGSYSSIVSSTPVSSIETLLRPFLNVSSPTFFLTFFVTGGIILVTIILLKQLIYPLENSNKTAYGFTVLGLAIVLLSIGFIAAVYPLLPIAKLVYWRYPIDIALIRGLTAMTLGFVILVMAKQILSKEKDLIISKESFIAIAGGTILLLASLTRDVFYGWYLLWSIPLFLLVKNRKIALTVLLCLLLVYPSYTHDNFASLGIEEPREWEGDFSSVKEWVLHSYFNETLDTTYNEYASMASSNDTGIIRFNTTELNDDQIDHISFVFEKTVFIEFSSVTDFVIKITSDWNPTFGPLADFEMRYEGYDNEDEIINGSIIPRTGILTNLTSILWRYSFSSNLTGHTPGYLTKIIFIVYPQEETTGSYLIDFIYTTNADLLNPMFLLIIPVLLVISLTSFSLLYLQLEKIGDIV